MVWTALALLLLALTFSVAALHVGGNAKASADATMAAVLAGGAGLAFVAAIVLGVMAWVE